MPDVSSIVTKRLACSLLVFALSFLFSSPISRAGTIVNSKKTFYQVIRVIDGDTIEVKVGTKKEKVRLIGIDTPETIHPTKTVECFGKEASEEIKKLLTKKKVRLEKDPTNNNRDQYQRLLRYVYLQNGTFVNAHMVQKGFAHAYILFPFQYMEKFKDYEKTAKQKSLGLWNPDVCPSNVPEVLNQSTDNDGKCIIKGNISSSNEKIYHLPNGDFYNKTVIDESQGERWFCNEKEAQAAGWRKSQR